MSCFATHIFGVAFASLIAGPASAQHITPDVRGVDDTKYFALLCMTTAPSFSQAVAEMEGLSMFDRTRDFTPFRRRPLPWDGSLDIVEAETSCACSVGFVLAEQFLPNFLNNFYVTLEREFAGEFRSGSQDPTRMMFEFDGVLTEVTISAGQRSDGIWRVVPQATRDGSCPA
jgi:hypothetical protein